MIKEHTAPGKGVGGQAITGSHAKADSSATETTAGGTSDMTKGADPLDNFHPKALPGHLAELKKHAGDKVTKGGDSQASSVGPYLGK